MSKEAANEIILMLLSKRYQNLYSSNRQLNACVLPEIAENFEKVIDLALYQKRNKATKVSVTRTMRYT